MTYADNYVQIAAVGYLRVSTDRQADHGLGLDIQSQAIQAWSITSGASLLHTYGDEGVSGTTEPMDRPGLAQAMSLVADGTANALVVAKLDRLARSLSIQEACLAQLWNWGAQVFSCDMGEIVRDDVSDPMRTALRQMVAVFAQLERSMITARMRDGRRRKAELGGYAYGAPAYGTTSVEGQLVAHRDETETVQRILELHDAQLSLRAIIRVLTREGHSPKRSSEWHPQTVKRIIDRAGHS